MSLALFFGIIFLVAIEIYLLIKPGKIELVIKAELLVVGSGMLLLVFIQSTGKMIQYSMLRYVQTTRNIQTASERREITRRVLRQIAFVLFSISIAIQIGLAAAT